ncbi:hypothetical protein [Aquimarina muelleri]|uniref:Uncharacterized protein n=1 Tax=Aquimarina muelleri TaxID=279356 RepID=A0A918JYR9_9FLAO|nr:hypothetical protein [Aquimarina muelleri]MCX2763713.1 hypothetical protein [Aquimarina muelleri]GGX30518.1 hypothetical protein GCM10007384_34580 [Aquimarina muelleri]
MSLGFLSDMYVRNFLEFTDTVFLEKRSCPLNTLFLESCFVYGCLLINNTEDVSKKEYATNKYISIRKVVVIIKKKMLYLMLYLTSCGKETVY